MNVRAIINVLNAHSMRYTVLGGVKVYAYMGVVHTSVAGVRTSSWVETDVTGWSARKLYEWLGY